MDIFFRTNKSLVKMKDKINIERGGYLTTSSLGGQEKYPLARYENEEKAMEILNRIDSILDKAISKNANSVSINLPEDE